MTANLWFSADLCKATGAKTNVHGWGVTGISIDTRSLQPGDLFIALNGPNFDGHDFVEQAFAKGASGGLVSREVKSPGPLLIVEDTLQALRDMAKFARARSTARIIALTGSVGKTGTKEALRHVLSFQGETHASAASFNNHWGAPLSLALLPPAAKYAIFELGMNHPGEIEPLSKLVRPHVAIVLNVEAVHLGPMGSLEAIAQAKAEIFAGLEPYGNEPRSTAIFNPWSNGALTLMDAIPSNADWFEFGDKDPETGCYITNAYITGIEEDIDGSTVHATVNEQPVTYRVPLPGRHNADNSLAVLLALCGVNLCDKLQDVVAHYATLPPVGGRGDRSTVAIPGGHITLIDETHNASPIATSAALKVLGMMQGGRRIAVLGDMLELGPDSQRFHTELANDIISSGITLTFLSGSNMAHLHEALPAGLRGGHAPDSTALLPLLRAALRDGDIVLVKGSRGSKMKMITDALKGPHAL